MMAYIASLIWNTRNKRLFQQEHSMPISLMRLCLCFYHDSFLLSSPLSLTSAGTLLKYWGTPLLVDLQNFSFSFVHSLPLPLGVLLVNFDEIVHDHSATIDFVIRNVDLPPSPSCSPRRYLPSVSTIAFLPIVTAVGLPLRSSSDAFNFFTFPLLFKVRTNTHM